jgi:hypothetical protein
MANFQNNNLTEYHIVKLEVTYADSANSAVNAEVILVSKGGLIIGPISLKNLKTPDIDEKANDLLAACYSNLREAFELQPEPGLTGSVVNVDERVTPPGFGDEDFNI